MPPDEAPQYAPLTLEGVQAELRARGWRWHFFGVPRYGDGAAVPGPDGEPRYWFNGSTMCEGFRLSKQPWGWFTLAEMLDEKFAEGCR